MSARESAVPLGKAYDLMRADRGYLHWWPASSPFEVCVGAILTQNTAWSNVEKALANLREADALSPDAIQRAPMDALEEWLRPSGYFRVKAKRLRAFVDYWVAGAGLRLFEGPLEQVRDGLLSAPGIGPETADSMLLYAGRRPVFVVDAYTKRVFSRHGWSRADVAYEELRRLIESNIDERENLLDYWGDFHAQLVMVGKDFCRPKNPRCESCPLRTLLPETGVEGG